MIRSHDWLTQLHTTDNARSDLSYIMQEYYTPPVTTMRMIKGPPAIVPVGHLKVTLSRFNEEVWDGDVELGSVAEQMAEVVLEENEEEESSVGEDIEEFIHPVRGCVPISL